MNSQVSPAPARKRIGFDGHILTGKPQGSATFLLNILRALAALNLPFDIVIYCDDPRHVQAQIGPSRFEYIRLRKMGALRRLIVEYPIILRRDRIDLAVFQYVCPAFSLTPCIAIVHDVLPLTHPHLFPFWFGLSRRLLFSQSIRRARAVVTVSHYSQHDIVKRFPDKLNQTFVVPNAPSFQPAATTGGPLSNEGTFQHLQSPFILAVGRIEKRKKIDLLVNAFIAANLPNIALVIVGSLDLNYRLAHPDHAGIHYFKNLSVDELAALYSAASLFVFPSEAEGFGIPVLDALMHGVPTIASDQTAIPEVTMGLAALFDPTQPDATDTLSSMIKAHFTGTPLVGPTKAQSQALTSRFNWEKSAKLMSDLIAQSVE